MTQNTKKNNGLLLYILNGPNLNLLGTREPEVYGKTTLPQIEKMCAAHAKAAGYAIVFRQSNKEGDLVDYIQEARTSGAGVIINPAGYTHTSVAILDALLSLTIPAIEVHLSNIARREAFRQHSYIAKGVTASIVGLGAQGYLRAIDAIAEILKGSK